MHANQPQRNMNRIHSVNQSNSLKHRDNVPDEADRLVAYQIKLLNLAQVSKVTKNYNYPIISANNSRPSRTKYL